MRNSKFHHFYYLMGSTQKSLFIRMIPPDNAVDDKLEKRMQIHNLAGLPGLGVGAKYYKVYLFSFDLNS